MQYFMRSALLLLAAPLLVHQTPAMAGGPFGGRSIGDAIGDFKGGPKWFPPRAEDSGSSTQAFVPPYMDADGVIYNGNSSSGGDRRPVSHGTLVPDAQGRGFWHSSYRDNYGQVSSPIRAFPRYDRPVPTAPTPPPQMHFVINGEGRAFANGTYLGQGRRVVNHNTGRSAWRFDIPNGWTLIRYDGANNTERHMFNK